MSDDLSSAQDLVLTLVAGGSEDVRRRREQAREMLDAAGAALTGERGLGASALEVRLRGEPGRVIAAVRRRQEGEAADWSVAAAPARPRRLLVCDMDSTIIGCECLDEIADLVGIKDEIARVTAQAMAGEIAFEPALEARVAKLAGVAEAQLERVYAERVRLNPGARTLTATMKAHGARTVLVSGGFTFFTEKVADAAGFDAHHANRLLVKDGALAGRVLPPILGRGAKRDALRAEAAALGVAPEDSVAIGDGANDIDMLSAAGLGIAYRAKPLVEAAAHARIATGDLRSALYFQGIAEADFVS